MRKLVTLLVFLVLGSTLFSANLTLSSSEGSVVGLWHFDEGYGAMAYDSSEYSNDGTIYSATWVEGKFGKALSFDGNDHVEVPHSSSLSLTNELTITVWIKLSDASNDQKIIGKVEYDAGTYKGYVVGVIHNRLYPEIWDSEGNRYVFTGGTLNDDEWTFLALTWKTNGRMIGYVNNKVVANIAASSNYIGTNTESLIVGRSPWHEGFWCDGVIDEIHIYNRALSESEVKENYSIMLLNSIVESISSLPDDSFEKEPEDRRASLVEKIEAVIDMLMKKHYKPAINKLERDIKDKTDKWVLDLWKTSLIDDLDTIISVLGQLIAS